MSRIKLRINGTESDDELRQKAYQNPLNGSYTFQICKKCGSFWVSETGDAKTAQILKKCEHCFNLTKQQIAEVRKMEDI